MEEAQIVPVEDRKTQHQFIEFPYQLYRQDPYWVPPLRLAVKDLLNIRKHPFFAHARMGCFLAISRGKLAGRIAAIHDSLSLDGSGWFGFLEMTNSQPVADALVAAARNWLAGCGIQVMRGPVNPSTNYECGTLVEGFEASPYVMTTYNPPYYGPLLEGAGLRKAKDLYAYLSSAPGVSGGKAMRVADRVLRSGAVSIRPVNLKNFAAEVESIWRIYTSAWQHNWGFAPMTREEFQLMAKDMKQILAPELALIGEVKGRPVGFALALPDINQALKPAGGNLLPFGLVKILYYQRRIRTLRVLALGVVEEYRTTGVAAAFYATLIRQARKLGFGDCEFSWVLEDNILMNRSIAALGARRYKTYRIYEGTNDHA